MNITKNSGIQWSKQSARYTKVQFKKWSPGLSTVDEMQTVSAHTTIEEVHQQVSLHRWVAKSGTKTKLKLVRKVVHEKLRKATSKIEQLIHQTKIFTLGSNELRKDILFVDESFHKFTASTKQMIRDDLRKYQQLVHQTLQIHLELLQSQILDQAKTLTKIAVASHGPDKGWIGAVFMPANLDHWSTQLDLFTLKSVASAQAYKLQEVLKDQEEKFFKAFLGQMDKLVTKIEPSFCALHLLQQKKASENDIVQNITDPAKGIRHSNSGTVVIEEVWVEATNNQFAATRSTLQLPLDKALLSQSWDGWKHKARRIVKEVLNVHCADRNCASKASTYGLRWVLSLIKLQFDVAWDLWKYLRGKQQGGSVER
jgi:hypothetical protein